MTGLIYFILEPELSRVKIGWSGREVRGRLAQFQTGNSQRLKLLGVIGGTLDDERQLHQRFNKWRLLDRAEWFNVDSELLGVIDGLLRSDGVRF